jgi:hypothetical protein
VSALPAPPEEPSRIDGFLPQHDFSASYQIPIKACRSLVYESLLHSDFSDLWVLRLLMSLRTGKRMPRHRPHVPGDLRQRLQGTGFVILDEVPDDELVIGVAGRFWRPDGGRCMDLTAADFIDFSRIGFAKAVWNFKLFVTGPQAEMGTTTLSTQTRIQCLGRAALWKFRAYWSLIGPFSGLIRKAILQQVKVKAEAKA